ncbi:dihydroorotase [Brucepastera parasyntrophica]|uniref:dihydroorotase n=1 Tax=Brucepastera parasyntrophica TaxID=2880008 RepID=UPI00210BE04A|nr:dihydroorotase [Brucepastera parasyntrophica]ULQ60927.1 dihydroorotase [Brucepastera parasyntrophica]
MNKIHSGGLLDKAAYFRFAEKENAGEQFFLVYNARLIDRDIDTPGALLIQDGMISEVYTGINDIASENVREFAENIGSPGLIDAQGLVIMPSFIDMHVHLRDPGHTRKEDIESASKAAAGGGYGTVVAMANTEPVISGMTAAQEVNDRARKIGFIDVFQAVSVTGNFDGADTSALATIDPSIVPVVSEDGHEVASAAVMLDAMEKCADTGAIISCHCEDPDLAREAKTFRTAALKTGNKYFADQNPFAEPGPQSGAAELRLHLAGAGRLLRLAEDSMTARNLLLAAEAGCRVHIAHVSTAGSLDEVRQAKRIAAKAGDSRSAKITCEVTPHHIALTDTTAAIVNPPLRTEVDREALIAGIMDGTVDVIATDHAPHTSADKALGTPGFSGIQTSFSVCNTVLVKSGKISLSELSGLMSANPAVILALPCGLLKSGYTADIVLLDPDAEWTVRTDDPAHWFSKGTNTPFAGKVLSGRVISTWKRGKKVYELQ